MFTIYSTKGQKQRKKKNDSDSEKITKKKKNDSDSEKITKKKKNDSDSEYENDSECEKKVLTKNIFMNSVHIKSISLKI